MKVRTYCRICEAACGLVADVEGGQVTRLSPDAGHPVTRGYACIKGPAMLDVHRDPDRLARPERRNPGNSDGWQPASWPDAMRAIGGEIARIREAHGPHAVGVYIGNPTAFSWALSIWGTGFLVGLGTRNFFNAATLDCQNKFAVAERMFGGYVVQPIPDLDRTDFFLCLGSNPLVSQMSFVMMPRALERLRGILQRNGRVVLVNPRRTETAQALSEYGGAEQIFIRPDTDVFLLMAMLRVIFDEALTAPLQQLDGVHELEAVARQFSVADAAAATGIPAQKIVELARSFALARRASAYCSTGVNMGSSGTPAFAAVQALNCVTGRLDAEGGARVPARTVRLAQLARLLDKLRPATPSRVGNFPQIAASIPTGLIADEILTPGDGQIRALIVVAGNPLLSAPGGERLARALASLDLLVSIDLYRNETGALAHWTLPATDWLERSDLPIVQVGMQPEPYAQWTDALVPPRDERRSEARIFCDLADAAGVRMFGAPGANAFLRRFGERAIARGIATAFGWPLDRMRRESVVRLDDDDPPGAFLRAVPTANGRVQLGHPELLDGIRREADRCRAEAKSPPALRLIGRRQRRSHNSWMHNLPRLRPRGAECPLYIHPDDARARDIGDGAAVELRSRHGRIRLVAAYDDALMPGTVSVPHGWGHSPDAGWRVAATPGETGANVNLLAGDGPAALEPLSGMARFIGIEVDLSPL